MIGTCRDQTDDNDLLAIGRRPRTREVPALRQVFGVHNCVVIVTDEQAGHDRTDVG